MRIHGDWLLTSQRAAIHLPSQTAVISDLHLGYSAVRCRAGEAVPGTPFQEMLEDLESLLRRRPLTRIIVAGDLFEDGLHADCLDDLCKLLGRFHLQPAIVPGNHDRGLDLGRNIAAVFPDGVEVGDWRVVHGHCPKIGERVIQGHLHPALRWRGLRAPCYLVAPKRIILPAFSRDAAGVNVLREPSLFGYRCAVIVGERVLDFGPVQRLGRRLRNRQIMGAGTQSGPARVQERNTS